MADPAKDPRQELGNFGSIGEMKAIVSGIEDALGEKAAAIAMLSAGRQRGKELATKLNLVDKDASVSLEEITEKAQLALGKEGTRLCVIDKIIKDGDVYKVYTRETFDSVGELQGSTRVASFTMGAIQGFLEAFLNQRLQGTQIESLLQGGSCDLFEYTIMGEINRNVRPELKE
jgi:predicted hydrocarbon binding protein